MGIVVDGYSKRDFHVVVPVDDDLFHDLLENPLALLIGQLVNALADLLRPGEDILHQPPLLSPARLLNPVIVQLRPGALKPLGDELALEIELGLGDLPRHEQPDGAVLFHLDVPQVSLGLGDVRLQTAALLRIEDVDTGDDQVGVLDYPLHLAPNRLLQLLSRDVGLLPAAQAHTLHPVALVVAAGSGQIVAVLLAVANVDGAPLGFRMEVVPALAASQQVLQQVEHLRTPLGLPATLFLQLLRPFPRLIVDHLRDRDLHPGVPRLVVDPLTVFGGDVAVLSVYPRARVGGIPQNVVHAGLKPQQLAGLCGDALVGQPHGNGVRPHPLIDVHVEDAADDLRLLFNHVEPAVVSDAVSVGDAAGGHPSLLGRPPLAQSGPLPEVVQLNLADGGHESEGLHVDGVHDGFQPYLVGLDDLHEGGGRIHAPAQAVGLPADDGVEASLSWRRPASLELGALLGPAPAHLLVAGCDGQPLALAVGFHLAYLPRLSARR